MTIGGDVMITDSLGGSEGPALAILARGTIEVLADANLRARAGSIVAPACLGQRGRYVEGTVWSSTYQYFTVRGGGGGNATVGGTGGRLFDPDNNPGAPGGGIAGTRALVPLQGGCAAGGAIDSTNGDAAYGAAGGGGLQLSSRVVIVVSGKIDASGLVGYPYAQGGGGAGGGILLEAPTVKLGAAATLRASGGDGYGCMPAASNCPALVLRTTGPRARGARPSTLRRRRRSSRREAVAVGSDDFESTRQR